MKNNVGHLIRGVLTMVLIYGVWTETGWGTALLAALVTLSIVVMAMKLGSL